MEHAPVQSRTFLIISAAGCLRESRVKRVRQDKKGTIKKEVQSKLDLGLDLKSSRGGKGSGASAVKNTGENV